MKSGRNKLGSTNAGPEMSRKVMFFAQITLFCLIISTCCCYSNEIKDGIINAKTIWFCLTIGIVLFFDAYRVFCNKKTLNLNWLDVSVIVFFSWMIINNCLHDFQLQIVKNIEDLGILLFYLFSKRIFCHYKIYKNALALFPMLLISVQIIIAILQWYGFFTPFNSSFRFTGFFFNPGPFAIFLAALSCWCLAVCLYTTQKTIKVAVLLLLLFSTVIILISQSRSAWIGLLSGILVLCVWKFESFAKMLTTKRFLKRAIPLLIPLICLAGFYLYHLKIRSADGRILTWKLSIRMVKDHPVDGLGQEGVRNHFLKYQSDYFKSHPEKMATEGKLSGEVWYSFNDYMQVLAEEGVLGFAFLVTMLWLFFKSILPLIPATNTTAQAAAPTAGATACAAVILISGLFSYPMSMLPIQILFFASVSCISAMNNSIVSEKVVVHYYHHFSLPVRFLFASILIFSGTMFFKFSKDIFDAYKIANEIDFIHYDKAATEKLQDYRYAVSCEPWYVINKCDGLIQYGKLDEAIALLNEGETKYCDKRIYFVLGNLYRSRKDYRRAEMQFEFLRFALPRSLKAKYSLQNLYYENDERAKLDSLEKEIRDFLPTGANHSRGGSFFFDH